MREVKRKKSRSPEESRRESTALLHGRGLKAKGKERERSGQRKGLSVPEKLGLKRAQQGSQAAGECPESRENISGAGWNAP